MTSTFERISNNSEKRTNYLHRCEEIKLQTDATTGLPMSNSSKFRFYFLSGCFLHYSVVVMANTRKTQVRMFQPVKSYSGEESPIFKDKVLAGSKANSFILRTHQSSECELMNSTV